MTKHELLPELQKLITLLFNGEYLKREIEEHLDESAQRNMYEILMNVLPDEVALIMEVEIRRKKFRENHPEPYHRNRMKGELSSDS